MKSKLYGALILTGSLVLFSGMIDLDNLLNYQNQAVPAYITKDNTIDNIITDAGATLGRVLFYDKKLSLNNTISCSSCHLQEFAFGDTAQVSLGITGSTTARHSMRLVNPRFGNEQHFFWDERAATLETQSTQPLRDHIEMGFSGTDGQPDIDSLLRKMEAIGYYKDLFEFVFGDKEVSEDRLQIALSQFMRSIQSFDSKYDTGRAQVDNNIQPFPNFTPAENMGKFLFTTPPEFDLEGNRIDGGTGCQSCHRAPEFDIAPLTRNNGVIGVAGGEGIDLSISRAPTLRDLFNPQGQLNGGMMHNGQFTTLEQVIDHYNQIPDNPINISLDPRLRPGENTQNLNLTDEERANLIAFLRTLTGSDMYTNEKWSDPFDENGELHLIGGPVVAIEKLQGSLSISVYPNPARDFVIIEGLTSGMQIDIFNQEGKHLINRQSGSEQERIELDQLSSGVYFVVVQDQELAGTIPTKLLLISK
jgi:cytochrome c peroxidase